MQKYAKIKIESDKHIKRHHPKSLFCSALKYKQNKTYLINRIHFTILIRTPQSNSI